MLRQRLWGRDSDTDSSLDTSCGGSGGGSGGDGGRGIQDSDDDRLMPHSGPYRKEVVIPAGTSFHENTECKQAETKNKVMELEERETQLREQLEREHEVGKREGKTRGKRESTSKRGGEQSRKSAQEGDGERNGLE